MMVSSPSGSVGAFPPSAEAGQAAGVPALASEPGQWTVLQAGRRVAQAAVRRVDALRSGHGFSGWCRRRVANGKPRRVNQQVGGATRWRRGFVVDDSSWRGLGCPGVGVGWRWLARRTSGTAASAAGMLRGQAATIHLSEGPSTRLTASLLHGLTDLRVMRTRPRPPKTGGAREASARPGGNGAFAKGRWPATGQPRRSRLPGPGGRARASRCRA